MGDEVRRLLALYNCRPEVQECLGRLLNGCNRERVSAKYVYIDFSYTLVVLLASHSINVGFH